MCCYKFLQESLLDSLGLIERQKYREGVNGGRGERSPHRTAYCGIVGKISLQLEQR